MKCPEKHCLKKITVAFPHTPTPYNAMRPPHSMSLHYCGKYVFFSYVFAKTLFYLSLSGGSGIRLATHEVAVDLPLMKWIRLG